jgi:hypothetical protein
VAVVTVLGSCALARGVRAAAARIVVERSCWEIFMINTLFQNVGEL